MQNIIITINNIIDSITGFFSGIHKWFENTSLEFSYFKYIWLLRIKNFILILVVVLIFIAIVLFLKKVAYGLVDEHYGIKEEKKQSKLKQKIKAKLEKRKVQKEMAEVDEEDFDNEDEEDELWYIKEKYRK